MDALKRLRDLYALYDESPREYAEDLDREAAEALPALLDIAEAAAKYRKWTEDPHPLDDPYIRMQAGYGLDAALARLESL